MNPFLSRLLDELRMARLTRRGATMKPEDVPTGRHKSYDRMALLELPEPLPLQTNLVDALRLRRSADDFARDRFIDTHEYGTLLGHALGKHEASHRRHYPSGGALYPVETYLITPFLGTQSGGVFHYNPTLHALEKLWNLPHEFDLKLLARFPEDMRFSALIAFTGVWGRSSAKYGDLAFLHTLLEAGHMSQNILLTATAMGLASRPMAGFDDSLVTELLDLDPYEEQPIHSLVLGRARTTDAGVGQ